jgi:hypothetical protein
MKLAEFTAKPALILQGNVSRFWQVGCVAAGFAMLGVWLIEGREAKRKLPVYQQLNDYGIVSAADESKTS